MICGKSKMTPSTCRLCSVAPRQEGARQLAVLAMKGAPCECSQHQRLMDCPDSISLALLTIKLCLSSQTQAFKELSYNSTAACVESPEVELRCSAETEGCLHAL